MFPSEKGLLPGAGAILAPLLTALGPNRPATAIGKPNSTMLDAIKAKCVFLRNLSSLSTLSRNYRRVFSAEC